VSSLEPKATETGLLVARILELPQATAGDLHEHERNSVTFCGDEAQFKAQVVRVLEHPQAPVFGDETGSEAQERFAQALASVMERYTAGNIAVVTHGTVLSLFVSRAAGIKAAPLWNRLGMPSFVVLRLPGYGIVEIVESV
jgi:broad specificity phosphatase PhoE